MRTDEVKASWQGNIKRGDAGSWNTGELNLLLKTRVDDAVKKINTGLVMELAMTAVLAILGTFYFLLDKTLNVPLLILFYFVCLSSIVFYGVVLRKITIIQLTGNNFKPALLRLIQVVRGFIKIYAYARILLLALFPFVFALPRVLRPNDHGMAGIILIWMAGIALSVMAHYGIKWYVNKLYFNYYRDLKECFKSLKD